MLAFLHSSVSPFSSRTTSSCRYRSVRFLNLLDLLLVPHRPLPPLPRLIPVLHCQLDDPLNGTQATRSSCHTRARKHPAVAASVTPTRSRPHLSDLRPPRQLTTTPAQHCTTPSLRATVQAAASTSSTYRSRTPPSPSVSHTLPKSTCNKPPKCLKNKPSSSTWHLDSIVPLPTRTKRWTLLRSPHVDKHSREQLELKRHKRLITITANTPAQAAADQSSCSTAPPAWPASASP